MPPSADAGPSPEAAEADGARAATNLLLIVVDTLRADRVGVYGARRDTTPSLDGFAADSVRFERAYSTAPWTVPSIASIFTGLYPSRHGARGTDHVLAAELDTLAEILSERGYATVGIISHLIISSARLFDQGFDKYYHRDARLGDEYVSTAGVTARAADALEDFATGERPFFLFVHYFDPHYRYINHPEVAFAPEQRDRVRGAQPIWELRRMDPPLTRGEIEFLEALYDEEVHHTDAGIGALLTKLDALGLSDDTVVVVTADHGEEFLERGWLGHTRTLYEELIRVPLIIRVPGRPPGVVREPVSLVSIAPTVLDLLGVDRLKYRFDGESLRPLVEGEQAESGGPVVAEVDYEEAASAVQKAFKKAIVDGRWKLIRDDETTKVELYDLESDPTERANLAASRPEIAERLVAGLERHLQGTKAPGGDIKSMNRHTLSPAEIEQLRILGYVSPEENR